MNQNSLCSDALVVNFGNGYHENGREVDKMLLKTPVVDLDKSQNSDSDSLISASTPMKKKKMALSIKMSNLSFNDTSREYPTSTPALGKNELISRLPKPDFLTASSKKRLSKTSENLIQPEFPFNCSQSGSNESNFGWITKSPNRKSLNILGHFPQSFRIIDPMAIMKAICSIKLNRSDSGNLGCDPWDPLDKNLIKPMVRETKVEYLSCLGNGDTGRAIKCRGKDGSFFVLKQYAKPVNGATDLGYMIKEAAALSQLSHYNIVTYIDSYVKDNHLFLKIEYCNGLNLRNIINNYTKIQDSPAESKIKFFLTQIAGALNHIHSKGIVHYDIKPDNIFTVDINFSEGVERGPNDFDPQYQNYKIGDFGQCFISGVYNIDVCEGDSRYIGRETLEFIDEYYSIDSTPKFLPSPCSDIFALSLTTAEYCGCGELPSRGEEWQSIRNGNLPPINKKYSAELHKLLMTMIYPEPDERPSSEYVLNCKYLNS